MPYPSVTIRERASTIAWFSGCAIVPIIRAAVPRGSCVSESSVITYRTPCSTSTGPPFTGKLS